MIETPLPYAALVVLVAGSGCFWSGRRDRADAIAAARARQENAERDLEHAVKAKTAAEGKLAPVEEKLRRTETALQNAGEDREKQRAMTEREVGELREQVERARLWEKHAGEGWALAIDRKDEAVAAQLLAETALAELQARWDRAFKRERGPDGRIVGREHSTPAADMALEPSQIAQDGFPPPQGTHGNPQPPSGLPEAVSASRAGCYIVQAPFADAEKPVNV